MVRNPRYRPKLRTRRSRAPVATYASTTTSPRAPARSTEVVEFADSSPLGARPQAPFLAEGPDRSRAFTRGHPAWCSTSFRASSMAGGRRLSEPISSSWAPTVTRGCENGSLVARRNRCSKRRNCRSSGGTDRQSGAVGWAGRLCMGLPAATCTALEGGFRFQVGGRACYH